VSRHGSRIDEPAGYPADGIPYLLDEARFDYLLNCPVGSTKSGHGVNTPFTF